MHRAEGDRAFKNLRLLQAVQNLALLLARPLQLKLDSHVLLRCSNLHVQHHGVDTFQNAVYLKRDFVGAAASDFVTEERRLQTESLFGASQQEKAKQNESCGKN